MENDYDIHVTCDLANILVLVWGNGPCTIAVTHSGEILIDGTPTDDEREIGQAFIRWAECMASERAGK